MPPDFQTRVAPPALLNDWLAPFCECLSLARAQIVVDQLRGALQTGAGDQIVVVTAGDFRTSDTPLAAAIAIQPAASPFHDFARDDLSTEVPPIDAATMVHAGSLQPVAEPWTSPLAAQLAVRMDQELSNRGVQYLQWATDVRHGASSEAVTRWCAAMGFRWLADLDYLSASLPLGLSSPLDADAPLAAPMRLRVDPLAWKDPDQWRAFSSLVEQTYVETRDCPQLADFRTALQTLQGYRNASSFSPEGWFRLIDRQNGATVGCLILGQHGKEEGSDKVSEVIYMGLVPQARRRGLGKEIMRLAENISQRAGSTQLILAVDQTNQPALTLYHRAGMQSLLQESVWVKSLACVDPSS